MLNWLTISVKQKHAVQLILYCYLYQQNFGKLPAEASIYSLVNISEGTFALNAKDLSMEEILEKFPLFIQQVFEKIYDQEIQFEHKVDGMVS